MVNARTIWMGTALLLLVVPPLPAQEGGTAPQTGAPQPVVQTPAEVPSPEQVPAQAEEQPAEEPAAGTLQVDKAVICRDVVEHEAVEPGTLFPADVEKLYCFTRVLGAEEPVTIHHVWYWNDRKMADVPLTVRSPRFRTYSSKRILPQWTGAWRVEITSPDGRLLGTAAFNVE